MLPFGGPEWYETCGGSEIRGPGDENDARVGCRATESRWPEGPSNPTVDVVFRAVGASNHAVTADFMPRRAG